MLAGGRRPATDVLVCDLTPALGCTRFSRAYSGLLPPAASLPPPHTRYPQLLLPLLRHRFSCRSCIYSNACVQVRCVKCFGCAQLGKYVPGLVLTPPARTRGCGRQNTQVLLACSPVNRAVGAVASGGGEKQLFRPWRRPGGKEHARAAGCTARCRKRQCKEGVDRGRGGCSLGAVRSGFHARVHAGAKNGGSQCRRQRGTA